ncbi:hypothetical protein BD770DRAFT_424587 [Pilaira anomala]|nr:hypothetical protein BD770DRAFT_424587 [Pilaira anomala]
MSLYGIFLLKIKETIYVSPVGDTTTDESDKNKHDLEVKDQQHHLQLMNTSYSCSTVTTATNSSINSLQVATNHPMINHHSDIEIPSRRQSHLYTPFHKNNKNTEPSEIILSDSSELYQRRSYYSAQLTTNTNTTDLNISTSSLTRSATWQPSGASPSTVINNTLEHPDQSLHADCIPDRRTSRNYAANPEIQARLNAMLNSDRASYLSSVLQSSTNNTTVHRRSTTP